MPEILTLVGKGNANGEDIETALELAAQRIQSGQLVGIPTETVYGLGASANSDVGVKAIYSLKGRPSYNPLICHVSSLEMAKHYGQLNATALSIAARFWPGPLTLVVEQSPSCPASSLVTAGLSTIALRMPEGLATRLIERTHAAIAAPSANRSGKLSPTTAEHVAAEFPGSDLLILDNGPCSKGVESTIVRIDGEKITLLRPGSIMLSDIEKALGRNGVRTGMQEHNHENAQIIAPGMMKSHYAPDAALVLDCTQPPGGASLLGFGQFGQEHQGPVANLSLAGNLMEAAANLYTYLRRLDETGVNTIYVNPIPNVGIGMAINDRLKRAAAPRNEGQYDDT